MKMVYNNVLKFFLVLLGCHIIFPAHAHAYIDPGTGSLILQALAAGAFTVLAFWRSLREKIVSFFKGKKSDEDK